jgi:hypothetical protein
MGFGRREAAIMRGTGWSSFTCSLSVRGSGNRWVGSGDHEWENHVICQSDEFVGIGNSLFDSGGYELNPSS